MNYHRGIMDWIDPHFDRSRNNRLPNQDFVDSHKSQLLVDIDKAKDGLELVREVESLSYQLNEVREHNDSIQSKLNKSENILSKFVETFWDYKIEEKSSMHRRNVFDTDEIIMPETNSYKLYKKIFNENQYPYAVKPWHKINMSIEVKEDGYVILSRKVIKIKTPEEIETAKKEKAKKLKAKKKIESNKKTDEQKET